MSLNLTSRNRLIARIRRGKEVRVRLVESHIAQGLASQLRATREEKGWSQARLAEETGMNQNAISRLERPDYGKATLTTLRRLAAAMDVALIVRFVPFSELVDWISGTPRVNRGLSAGSLGVLDYGKEEAAGLFAVAVSGAASRGAAAVTRGSEFRIVVDDVGPVQRVLFRPALKDVSIDVPFTDGASTSHTVRSSQSVAK